MPRGSDRLPGRSSAAGDARHCPVRGSNDKATPVAWETMNKRFRSALSDRQFYPAAVGSARPGGNPRACIDDVELNGSAGSTRPAIVEPLGHISRSSVVDIALR